MLIDIFPRVPGIVSIYASFNREVLKRDEVLLGQTSLERLVELFVEIDVLNLFI